MDIWSLNHTSQRSGSSILRDCCQKSLILVWWLFNSKTSVRCFLYMPKHRNSVRSLRASSISAWLTCISSLESLLLSLHFLLSSPLGWGRAFSLIWEKSSSLSFLFFASEAPRIMGSGFYRNTKTRKPCYKPSRISAWMTGRQKSEMPKGVTGISEKYLKNTISNVAKVEECMQNHA